MQCKRVHLASSHGQACVLSSNTKHYRYGIWLITLSCCRKMLLDSSKLQTPSMRSIVGWKSFWSGRILRQLKHADHDKSKPFQPPCGSLDHKLKISAWAVRSYRDDCFYCGQRVVLSSKRAFLGKLARHFAKLTRTKVTCDRTSAGPVVHVSIISSIVPVYFTSPQTASSVLMFFRNMLSFCL